MNWHPFDEGASLGKSGSEGGRIVRDEEHCQGARITLEQGGRNAPFAITCGIYGWMIHTRFFGDESEAEGEFKDMKMELTRIIDIIPLAEDPEANSKLRDVSESLSRFVERFPT